MEDGEKYGHSTGMETTVMSCYQVTIARRNSGHHHHKPVGWQVGVFVHHQPRHKHGLDGNTESLQAATSARLQVSKIGDAHLYHGPKCFGAVYRIGNGARYVCLRNHHHVAIRLRHNAQAHPQKQKTAQVTK